MGFRAEIQTVGPAKEEKKEEKKTEAPAKDEKKKDAGKKKAAEPAPAPTLVYHAIPNGYVPYNDAGYPYTIVREENPASCTIL